LSFALNRFTVLCSDKGNNNDNDNNDDNENDNCTRKKPAREAMSGSDKGNNDNDEAGQMKMTSR
jgi:hypothetical protein